MRLCGANRQARRWILYGLSLILGQWNRRFGAKRRNYEIKQYKLNLRAKRHSIRTEISWQRINFSTRNILNYAEVNIKNHKKSEGIFKNKIWPPQSPDLNQIEHLWEELGRNIRNRRISSQEEV